MTSGGYDHLHRAASSANDANFALSRRGPCADRPACRPGAGVLPPNGRAGRAGQGRQAASTRSDDRHPLEALPDIPAVGEFVPGYEASVWFGLGAPNGTPAEIIDKLNQETNAALADPKIKGRLAESGGKVLAGSPADFGKLIADETEKWGNVIRALNIKAE